MIGLVMLITLAALNVLGGVFQHSFRPVDAGDVYVVGALLAATILESRR